MSSDQKIMITALSLAVSVNGLSELVLWVPNYRSRDPGFYSRRYQIFWEVMGQERGPLSFVSTIEELFWRKSSGFGLESREYGRRDPLCWPRTTLHPQKIGTNFTDKQRSLAGWGHGVRFGTDMLDAPRQCHYSEYSEIRLSAEERKYILRHVDPLLGNDCKINS
jgi:hypothetical protein